MSGNTFGRLFCLTTFGESHGLGLGGVIDGCPAGIPLDEEFIQKELDRRRPGTGAASTTRKEPDRIQILSGLFNGLTTGTPIGFFIANRDQHSQDYGELARVWRPGHADMTYDAKYGIRDYRGGGRASGRETVARVAGGAIAKAFLVGEGITVKAYTLELGGIPAKEPFENNFDLPYYAPNTATVALWDERVKTIRADGDSLGGIVRIEAFGVPAGLGDPVFDKLDALLACAIMSVGAVKGVEIGDGFSAARSLGSQNNDPFFSQAEHSQKFTMPTNHCGGILGGISTGQTLIINAAVKPIPSISKEQKTLDKSGNAVKLHISGRHDICAIPRIIPVLEAMTSLVLADRLLIQRTLTKRCFC